MFSDTLKKRYDEHISSMETNFQERIDSSVVVDMSDTFYNKTDESIDYVTQHYFPVSNLLANSVFLYSRIRRMKTEGLPITYIDELKEYVRPNYNDRGAKTHIFKEFFSVWGMTWMICRVTGEVKRRYIDYIEKTTFFKYQNKTGKLYLDYAKRQLSKLRREWRKDGTDAKAQLLSFIEKICSENPHDKDDGRTTYYNIDNLTVNTGGGSLISGSQIYGAPIGLPDDTAGKEEAAV